MAVIISAIVALACLGVLLVAARRLCVKFRWLSQRWLGGRVCDFGADVTLPPPLASRSYQIALYLTMKSSRRDPPAAAP